MLRHGEEVANGRLILLHDPAGHDAWSGTLRLVTYVTADLEPELASDPMLTQLDILDAGKRHSVRLRSGDDAPTEVWELIGVLGEASEGEP